MGHGHAYATKNLNALGDKVPQLHLLLKVLIEKKVQLIKGRTADLPMGFLIEVTQAGGVREQPIQPLTNLLPGVLLDADGQILNDGAELLDLPIGIEQD